MIHITQHSLHCRPHSQGADLISWHSRSGWYTTCTKKIPSFRSMHSFQIWYPIFAQRQRTSSSLLLSPTRSRSDCWIIVVPSLYFWSWKATPRPISRLCFQRQLAMTMPSERIAWRWQQWKMNNENNIGRVCVIHFTESWQAEAWKLRARHSREIIFFIDYQCSSLKVISSIWRARQLMKTDLGNAMCAAGASIWSWPPPYIYFLGSRPWCRSRCPWAIQGALHLIPGLQVAPAQGCRAGFAAHILKQK